MKLFDPQRSADAPLPKPRSGPGAAASASFDIARARSESTARFHARPRTLPRPRVGFLTPSLHLGGAEIWIATLMAYLDRERLEIAGVATTTGGLNDSQMVAACIPNAPVFAGPDAVGRLKTSCDAIVAWGVCDLADRVAGFGGSVVLVAHGSCDGTRSLLGAALAGATHLAAVSETSASAFPSDLTLGRDITIIHNGVDPRRCISQVSRTAVRHRWGVRAHEVAIGHVGRLSPEKNPLAVARAVAQLGDPFRAVYVGDSRWHNHILAQIRQLCPNAVIEPPAFHVGDVLNSLDCFLLASPHEGFSLALAEAWYCGVPTVVTAAGALAELEAAHGQLALRVPFDPSAEQLAEAVRRAVCPTNWGLVERTASLVRQRFTADIMGRKWTEYLLAILTGAVFRSALS